MPINHAKVSILADGADADQIQPSNWNAAHSAPTLAEVLAASPAAYAGVARVIGPFSVAWDTPGFVNPSNFGVALVPLPAGVIVRPFALITTAFDKTGELDMYGALTDLTDGFFMGAYALSDPPLAVMSSIGGAEPSVMPSALSPIRFGAMLVDGVLSVAMYPDADPPTAGAADIYALVQYP